MLLFTNTDQGFERGNESAGGEANDTDEPGRGQTLALQTTGHVLTTTVATVAVTSLVYRSATNLAKSFDKFLLKFMSSKFKCSVYNF